MEPRISRVTNEFWIYDGPAVSFLGFPYPTRSAVARLADGRLWVWSPTKLDDDLKAKLDVMGEVAHLVSPNRLHHLFLAEWKAAYPHARLWGPQSTIARHSELPFEPPLENSPPAAWAGTIDQVWFRGSRFLDEIVFFHRPSRTALVTDLIQAFTSKFLDKHWSWWQRPIAWYGGIMAQTPGAPRDLRLSFTDRRTARAARSRVLAWPTERVIIAHGEWCRANGREYLARGLSWLGPCGMPSDGP